MRLVFWNLGRSDLLPLLEGLVAEFAPDILLLAEQSVPLGKLLPALAGAAGKPYVVGDSFCKKVQVLTSFASDLAPAVWESDRVTMRKVQVPASPEFLLVSVHLPSKREFAPESQQAHIQLLAEQVRGVEAEEGLPSIVVGDLNVDPFEPALTSAAGLHAVMDRRIAAKGGRVVQGETYPFFYNPMWQHFGDKGSTPSGTHYYRHSEHICLFWHMFDQALIRPELLPALAEDSVRVITDISGVHLTKLNGPGTLHSDHLPILLDLHLENL